MRFASFSFPAFASCLAASFTIGAPSSVEAGAWTQKEGHGQVILQSSSTRSTHQFDDDGRPVRRPTYRKIETNLLIEYGLTDWLTAMVQPQLRKAEIGAPTNADSFGAGYTEFGGRVRLRSDDSSVLSMQMLGRLSGLNDETNPAEVGNTDPEFDIRALYGRAFMLREWNAFIDAQLGYRVRVDDPPNEFRFDLTFGVRPTPDLLLIAQSFNTISDGSARGIFDDGREHKLQLSAVWDMDESWSVQLGVAGTIDGENALRERGVLLSIWRKF